MRGALVVLTMAFVVLCFCSGCGGWQSQARTTLELGAKALNTGEQLAARALRADCGGLSSEAEVRVCYDVRGFDDVRAAIALSDRSLRLAQSVLDTEAAPSDWLSKGACVLSSLSRLAEVLAEANVRVPPEVSAVVNTLSVLGGQCAHAEGVAP